MFYFRHWLLLIFVREAYCSSRKQIWGEPEQFKMLKMKGWIWWETCDFFGEKELRVALIAVLVAGPWQRPVDNSLHNSGYDPRCICAICSPCFHHTSHTAALNGSQ